MFNKINKMFDFNQKILNFYSKREEILSSNIANADTPNYKAMDISFKDEIEKIIKKNNSAIPLKKTSLYHLNPKKNDFFMFEVKPIVKKEIKSNGNTVDMNRERIEFIKNTLKYEENLVFIKNEIKNIMHVLKG
ncbi:flagellar basal body rod protein FlgB [Buchnera aphidicola]|uniref:Flagellar basal body rod protein FlgB n=1 Tax=Buchnera aphidicola subsp. Rhopalosiphum maidis TaxID=118109 RepID=A0A3G2I5M6_BUCRM|nr:flagellar basal body rod protein FlgB [Buchnera aphidicola]AYN24732.1 flagellar basal body rod protein FlgB [Buchnera aphidicola (Rhopalosiphum maidis)]